MDGASTVKCKTQLAFQQQGDSPNQQVLLEGGMQVAEGLGGLGKETRGKQA